MKKEKISWEFIVIKGASVFPIIEQCFYISTDIRFFKVES